MQPTASQVIPPALQDLVKASMASHHLTHREKQIVWLVIAGLNNREIARRCYITEQTVKDHLKHIYRKIGVHQRTALVAVLLKFSPHRIQKRGKAAARAKVASR